MPKPRSQETGPKSTQVYQDEAKVLSSAQKIEMFPVVLDSGRGAILTDVDGREYIDFSSGGCVANIGYCHPYLVRALSEQAARLNFSLTVFNASELNLSLARRLIDLVPIEGETKVMFSVSGTDACEGVYKLLKSHGGRPRIISNMGAVHGFTMGALSMSGFRGFSRFLTLSDCTKVPYPYCYRCPMGRSRSSCGLECLAYVEDYVFQTVCEPEQVAGWVIEAVQGDAGYIVPPKEYLEGVERICRRHGMLLVMDEILTGLGRTGKLFAYEHFGIHPDLVILGKALGGGVPFGAVVGRRDVMDSIPGKHVASGTGALLGVAAALAVLDAIRDEGMVENAAEVGGELLELLRRLMAKSRLLGDVRGVGLGIGVEIVDPRDGYTPAPELAREVARTAAGHGVFMFVLGVHLNVLMIAPPLVLSHEQAKLGVERLERAVLEVEHKHD